MNDLDLLISDVEACLLAARFNRKNDRERTREQMLIFHHILSCLWLNDQLPPLWKARYERIMDDYAPKGLQPDQYVPLVVEAERYQEQIQRFIGEASDALMAADPEFDAFDEGLTPDEMVRTLAHRYVQLHKDFASRIARDTEGIDVAVVEEAVGALWDTASALSVSNNELANRLTDVAYRLRREVEVE